MNGKTIRLEKVYVSYIQMTLIRSFSMVFLFVVTIITSIPGSSTFAKNKDSVYTSLPFNISNPPDVWFNVPNLSIDRISLVVENLKTRVSISANVASLVSLNAGVDISMDKVNLTIKGKIDVRKCYIYFDFSRCQDTSTISNTS